MTRFLISLLFFLVALASFWAVLHWIRYKKRADTCTCGKGACLTDPKRLDGDRHRHEKENCNASDCQCDE